MARPTKLTKQVQERIARAIRVGATYELAAQYGGIHYDTFNEWMKAGREAESGEFYEFSEAIKKAEGEAAYRSLSRIETAAKKGNWQADAWKLERRYPQSYGRQVHEHDIGGEGNKLAELLKELKGIG